MEVEPQAEHLPNYGAGRPEHILNFWKSNAWLSLEQDFLTFLY